MPRRSRSRLVAVLAGLLTLAGATIVGVATPAAAAGIEDTPPNPGEYRTFPIPDRPALPGVGNTYIDPTFGTEVMQVTGPGGTHAYAYWPTFNRDSTKLYIFDDPAADGPTFYDFNPSNFVLGARQDPPLAFIRTCSAEDAMWSGVDPNVIHCHDRNGTIYAYNVVTRALTLIKDLGAAVPRMFQMTRSLDDRVFGFRLRAAEPDPSYIGWITWDRTTDTVQTRLDGNVDEIHLDKTGQYILESKSEIAPGPDAIQNTVIERATGERTDLTNGAPDYAPGHGDLGTRTVIGHDDWENRLLTRDLATPHDYSSLLQWENFRQDYHGSAIADDESWFLVSAYGTLTGPLASEVFQVRTDGSGTVRHLAHTFSSELPADYYHTPRAAISRDGRFATYVSDWGTGTVGYVMVARIA